jgi:hypothetical protein
MFHEMSSDFRQKLRQIRLSESIETTEFSMVWLLSHLIIRIMITVQRESKYQRDANDTEYDVRQYQAESEKLILVHG